MPTLQNINGASLVANPQSFGSGFGLGFKVGDTMKQRGLEDEQRQKQADWDARVDGLTDEALAGNQEALIRIFKNEPEYAKGIAGVLQSRSVADAKKLQDEGNRLGRAAGGLMAMGDDTRAQTQAMMNLRADALEAGRTGEAEEWTNQINQMQTDPNAVKFGWQQDMANAQDADSIFKHFTSDDMGGAKGGDLPAEAVAFNDLIKDFTAEQQKTAKLVKAGLKGRAMSNAELSAIESGDIKGYADWKAKMKQQQKFAEMTGSSRAKAIDRGFDSIVKIDSGISNIDRAIAAVDSGAGVGAVEKLWPSIKSASVALDNIRGEMALDVVGATTFGALSKGELDLAKDIALPTGLDSAELKDYLVKKKVAQEKLRAYYNEQIQFLDQGGTVAGFLREKERRSGGRPAATEQQPAQPQQQPAMAQVVTSQAQFDSLPSGALYTEDGVQYRKP